MLDSGLNLRRHKIRVGYFDKEPFCVVAAAGGRAFARDLFFPETEIKIKDADRSTSHNAGVCLCVDALTVPATCKKIQTSSHLAQMQIFFG